MIISPITAIVTFVALAPRYYTVLLGKVVDYPSLLATYESRSLVNFWMLFFIPLFLSGITLLRRYFRAPHCLTLLALGYFSVAFICNGLPYFFWAVLPYRGTILKTAQTVEFGGDAYHLTYSESDSEESFVREFIVFQCDSTGISCRAIQKISDTSFYFAGTPKHVSLEMDNAGLYVQVGQEATRVVPQDGADSG